MFPAYSGDQVAGAAARALLPGDEDSWVYKGKQNRLGLKDCRLFKSDPSELLLGCSLAHFSTIIHSGL